MTTFSKDLAELINKHSAENSSNTPDYLLAEYLVGCLAVYAAAVKKRDAWYGVSHAAPTATAKDSIPVDLDHCPSCGGPADNGNDREYPPNPYPCSKCDPI